MTGRVMVALVLGAVLASRALAHWPTAVDGPLRMLGPLVGSGWPVVVFRNLSTFGSVAEA